MAKRIILAAVLILTIISLLYSSSFYIDIGKDQLIQSETFTSITFNEWNELLPTPKTSKIIDQVDDMIYRFDILNKCLYYIKYNNQQVIKYSFEDSKEETIFEETNKIITDIAVHEGRIYISVIPDGEIYVYDQKGFSLFGSTDAKYIWDIEPSPCGLAIITGSPCSISIINTEGETLQEYPLADINGSLIRFDGYRKRFFAGTSNNGLLYSFDPEKKKLVCLYQKPDSRIISIAFDKDGIYFAEVAKKAANFGQTGSSNIVTITAQDPSRSQTYTDASNESATQFQQFSQADTLVSNIYRLDESDESSHLIYSQSSAIYDFDVINDYIYILSDQPSLVRVNKDYPEQKQNTLYKVGSMLYILKRDKGYYVSTGYPGYVYQFYPDKYEKSEWVSDVYSMDTFLEYGRIMLKAGSNSRVSIRTGNSLLPDDSWSEWHSYSRPSGLDDLSMSIYFQVKIETGDNKDSFIKNLRIYIKSISSGCRLKDINISKEAMAIGNAMARQRPPQYRHEEKISFERVHPFDISKPIVITWNYENMELCQEQTQIGIRIIDYDSADAVFEETVYNTVRYELNKAFFPDGLYYAELGISSLFSEDYDRKIYRSDTFIMDNTPPDIIISEEREDGLLVEVSDCLSTIALAYIEYIDHERLYIAPKDAIFDSKSESFWLKKEMFGQTAIFTVYDMEGNKKSLLLTGRGLKNED